jgi:hypothetical protein
MDTLGETENGCEKKCQKKKRQMGGPTFVFWQWEALVGIDHIFMVSELWHSCRFHRPALLDADGGIMCRI